MVVEIVRFFHNACGRNGWDRLKKKTKKKWLYFLIGVATIILFFYFQNNAIVISEYTISSDKLPQSFDEYRIVQLSDLHNKSFGNDQSSLVKKVNNAEPDLIVF